MTRKLLGPYRIGDVVEGLCRITDFLGQGYSGFVYSARLLKSSYGLDKGSQIALKLYKDHITSDAVNLERINREFRFGKNIRHPNIIRIFDLRKISLMGKEGLCLIMEHISGQTLEQVLRSKRLSFEETCIVMEQLLTGLSQFHKSNHIHRDIKPSNLLMDKSGVLKIADFGVVKRIGEATITPSDEFLGTIRYAAPELLFGGDYDYRVDIYSAGAVFYEMLFGRPILAEIGRFSQLVVAKTTWDYDGMANAKEGRSGDTGNAKQERFPISTIGQYVVYDSLRSFLSRDPRNRYRNCEEALELIRKREESSLIASRYPCVFQQGLSSHRMNLTRGPSPDIRKRGGQFMAKYFSNKDSDSVGCFLKWLEWVARHDVNVREVQTAVEQTLAYALWKPPKWADEIIHEIDREKRLRLFQKRRDATKAIIQADDSTFNSEAYVQALTRLFENESDDEIRSSIQREINYVQRFISDMDEDVENLLGGHDSESQKHDRERWWRAAELPLVGLLVAHKCDSQIWKLRAFRENSDNHPIDPEWEQGQYRACYPRMRKLVCDEFENYRFVIFDIVSTKEFRQPVIRSFFEISKVDTTNEYLYYERLWFCREGGTPAPAPSMSYRSPVGLGSCETARLLKACTSSTKYDYISGSDWHFLSDSKSESARRAMIRAARNMKECAICANSQNAEWNGIALLGSLKLERRPDINNSELLVSLFDGLLGRNPTGE